MVSPLFEAKDARIAVDGVIAVEGLTVSATGDRVLFAGDTAALFAALTGVPLRPRGAGRLDSGRSQAGSPVEDLAGEAAVVSGTLTINGKNVLERGYVGSIGAAALDPPLPPTWTAEEYVQWSARLGGAGRGEGRELARVSLGRVGLGGSFRRMLSALSLPERRALGLAQAAVLGPAVIVAEAPLAGLEGAGAAFVTAAIAGATEKRRALLSAARIDVGSAEGALAREASHVIVLAGGRVMLEGPPGDLFSGASHYTVTVRANAQGFRTELGARGIDLRGGPIRFSLALPAGTTTRDVMVAAKVAGASVVELLPILG